MKAKVKLLRKPVRA